MSESFKPCPFCGDGELSVERDDDVPASLGLACCVRCSCGAEGPTRNRPGEAMKAWNKRADSARALASKTQEG